MKNDLERSEIDELCIDIFKRCKFLKTVLMHFYGIEKNKALYGKK